MLIAAVVLPAAVLSAAAAAVCHRPRDVTGRTGAVAAL